jgi:hypothetical protein
LAKNVTLGQLRTWARQRANQEQGQFISDSEANGYVNLAAAELYDLLIAAYPDYFSKTSDISIIAGTEAYSLPSDFYKLLGVDYLLDTQGNAVSLKPYQIAERNRFMFAPSFQAFGLNYLRYHIQAQGMNFKPTPAASGTVRLIYIPAFSDLSSDSDTFDTVDAWHEYIILDAAIKMLLKEESDASVLLVQKEAMKRRIEELAHSRDIGTADRVTDVTQSEPWGVIGWGSES